MGLLTLVKSALGIKLSKGEAAGVWENKTEKAGDQLPLLYSEAELDAIEQHVARHFGEYQNVFHEIVSPDLHIDLLILEPRPGHDFYTLITMGAGAYRMEVPAGYSGPKRAEFLISLPKDWDIHSKEERFYWPLRWLKILARFSLTNATWLGWGHTVPAGEAVAENTLLSSVLLTAPDYFGEDSISAALPSGEAVAFWQLVPLYEEELQYKLRNGAEGLEEAFGGFPVVLDISRPCVVGGKPQKTFALQAEQIQDLFSWEQPMGCLATDRIVVDGAKVGYLYREAPEPDKESYDSGWRFTAGDEDDDYMDNPENAGVYSLNTIANYDPAVIPLLTAGYSSAFVRNESGEFIEVEFVPPAD
ncbi:MAG: DUF2185 domain-containing protein [Sporomusaceae bacterium]|nr:DUF2185 domain-containing protein [Sporomusaceae bacterium]